jgi:hypothetical protein
MTTLDQLAESLGRHTDVPIPGAGSADEQIGEARSELIAYDSHVAGVATSVLAGADVPPAWLSPDTSALDQRLDALSASAAPIADDFRRYKQVLDDLLALSGQALGEGGTGAGG